MSEPLMSRKTHSYEDFERYWLLILTATRDALVEEVGFTESYAIDQRYMNHTADYLESQVKKMRALARDMGGNNNA